MARKHLSPERRRAIVKLREEGVSAAVIARCFDCNVSTVYNTCNVFKDSGRLESLPRSGRPYSSKDNLYVDL